jgi:polyhydroxybutyrate depolymerase
VCKIVAIVALCLMAAACGSSGDADSAAGSSSTAAPTTVSTTSAAPSSSAPATTASSTTGATTTQVVEDSDPCGGATGGSGSSMGVLSSGGHDYQYFLFVPSSYDGNPVPLVMEFHGLGSNGSQQNGLSAYSALAIQEGFAVVSPTGVANEAGQNSWELAQFDVEGRDDVQMASDLIDAVSAVVCIDQSRVFATGLSNGGYFSALLACRLADRVAATFSVAAISHPEDCSPSRPIAMGAVHGTADLVVPYGGGESSLVTTDEAREEFADFFAQVMPEETAEFAADFGCSTVTDTEVGSDVELRTHTGCERGVEVRFYTVEGGGHTWPGSDLAKAFEGVLGYATTTIDATEDGWAFMSQYSLP